MLHVAVILQSWCQLFAAHHPTLLTPAPEILRIQEGKDFQALCLAMRFALSSCCTLPSIGVPAVLQEQTARDIESGGQPKSPTMAEERERSVRGGRRRRALTAAPNQPRHAFPWMSLVLCVVSIGTAAIGAWLLFATHGVISSAM